MGVNLIVRIAAVGILVSVLCQILKHSGREEQAALITCTTLFVLRSDGHLPSARRILWRAM